MYISAKRIPKKAIMVLCAFMMLITVFTVYSVKSHASSARTYSGTEKLYVNLANCGNSWWTNSGCYHRAYFFGTNTAWASLEATSTSGIYSITVPAGTYTNVILCRCSTSTTTWSSGTVYNQTGDIALDATANYISYFGGAGSTTATWATYGSTATTAAATTAAATTAASTTAAATTAAATATASSNTLYVNIGACGNTWWGNTGCYHRIYFYGSTDTAWASLAATSTSGIYSCTVPSGSFTTLVICRTSTSDTTWSTGTVYNKTGDITMNSSYNYISYFAGEGSTTATWATYGSTTTATPTATTTATATATSTSTSTATGLASSIDKGVILHAFNWSYNTIKDNLANIAAAGFTTVQTSPVQQPKDYSSSYTSVSGQWWKLYQPIAFSVGEYSWLGTSSDFSALCTAADSYGIKIVCDIVVNHLGGNTSSTDLNPGIATYESTIYNDYSTYFHTYYSCSDDSIVNVVYGNIGMPDLNTGNSYVQGRVLSLLKQCIDLGADGFRFDAAKHIETANDGSYASGFWANTLGAAKTYASSKGTTLFAYGEILNTVGSGRSFSGYTGYMRVTDNKASDAVTYGVYSSTASSAASSYYNTGLTADNLVLWNESHDTYMGSSGSAGMSNTASYSTTICNKGWAMVASRANAVGLYFARPGSATMGNKGTDYYTYSEVAAVNFFHNKFAGSYEYLSSSGSIAMNERYTTKGASGGGAVLVNVSGGSTSVSITANALGSGSYTDKITGNTFTVSNGTLTGTIGSTGIAVIY